MEINILIGKERMRDSLPSLFCSNSEMPLGHGGTCWPRTVLIYVCCPSGIVNRAPFPLTSVSTWRVNCMFTLCRHCEGPYIVGIGGDSLMRSRLCSQRNTYAHFSSLSLPPPFGSGCLSISLFK